MGWTNSGSDVYITGGNVGIGTTSPQALLHITGADGATAIRIDGGAAQKVEMPVNDISVHLGLQTENQENDPKIFWYAGGGGAGNWDSSIVGVGRTFSGLGQGYLRFRTHYLEIDDTGDAYERGRAIKFRHVNPLDDNDRKAAVIKLDHDGTGLRLMVDNGDIDPYYDDHTRVRIAAHDLSAGSAIYTEGDGQTLTTDAPSSQMYKDDIKNLDPDVNRIFKLQLKSFTWKSTKEADFGFLAEDIKATIPELYRDKTGVIGWKADRFPFYLFQALKELKARVDALERRPNIQHSSLGGVGGGLLAGLASAVAWIVNRRDKTRRGS